MDVKLTNEWVSDWLLFNANSSIFLLYHGKNKLIFNEVTRIGICHPTRTHYSDSEPISLCSNLRSTALEARTLTITTPMRYDLPVKMSLEQSIYWYGWKVRQFNIPLYQPDCRLIAKLSSSEWLLLNANTAIFQLYHEENKLISMRWKLSSIHMVFACKGTTI
jgi:hypothetical protein